MAGADTGIARKITEADPPFRFDAIEHRYFLDGLEISHITELLERSGWADSTWMTEESADRGREVHALTSAYDLGALDVATVTRHRGYLLGHVKVMEIARSVWADIEVARVHPQYRFGGRPDRVGTVFGLRTVWEIKTGQPTRGHAIQLALQAILVAGSGGVPADAYQRCAEYLKPTGKFVIERFENRKDFDEAYRIVKEYCR